MHETSETSVLSSHPVRSETASARSRHGPSISWPFWRGVRVVFATHQVAISGALRHQRQRRGAARHARQRDPPRSPAEPIARPLRARRQPERRRRVAASRASDAPGAGGRVLGAPCRVFRAEQRNIPTRPGAVPDCSSGGSARGADCGVETGNRPRSD